MKALIINCSPARTRATAEIVNIIEKEISSRYDTKCICIDDYSFTSIEYKENVELRKQEIKVFCKSI